jgi:hypothetical protein
MGRFGNPIAIGRQRPRSQLIRHQDQEMRPIRQYLLPELCGIDWEVQYAAKPAGPSQVVNRRGLDPLSAYRI